MMDIGFDCGQRKQLEEVMEEEDFVTLSENNTATRDEMKRKYLLLSFPILQSSSFELY